MLNFFKDKKGQITIFQLPNNLLIGWFILFFFTSFLWEGAIEEILTIVTITLLLLWSYDEMISGDSPFRQVLGGVVFLIAVYNIF